MRDIENRQDIELIVNLFYRKLLIDPVVGHFFTKVIHLSIEVHLPVIVSFWETILLGTISYKGNPMIKHLELNRLSPLARNHFDQWLQLWEETIHENFNGPKSEEAVTRAKAIAELMQYKITTQ